MTRNWHTESVASIFEILGSNEHGLGQDEVIKRLEQYGPNKLPEAKGDSLLGIFLRQFQSPLIYILLFATVTVFAIGAITDGLVILAVLIFNAIVGTIQEGRAQNTLRALQRFVETRATVRRDGKELIIPDDEVVPGDIIILHEGDKVPADSRIILASSLKVNESALTGESGSESKTEERLKKRDVPFAEQRNMLFKGSYIVAGNARAIVTATGVRTVVGGIARAVSAIDTEMPLKADIRRLSRIIIVTVAVISTSLFFLGIYVGQSAKTMFTTAVSLTVSIIPEGLPIVITLVLATGVWRMGRRNALVRRLQAVEALGQAEVLAVDKTGTITRNEMTVQEIYVPGRYFQVQGTGYEPKGDIFYKGSPIEPLNHPELILMGKASAFCANARLMFSEEAKEWQITGDPTEAALLVLAQKMGFDKDDLEKESPKIAEIPFDYRIKYHATVHQSGSRQFMTVVGAPEVVLKLSKRMWRSGTTQSLTKKDRDELEKIFLRMSQDGLRVLAVAVSNKPPEIFSAENINSLSFVGFLGMSDLVRPEVPEAMERARAAGIRVVMITGDHKLTALAVAKEAAIYTEGDEILTGETIDDLRDEELADQLSAVSVFARVTPEHKLRIIQAYRKRGMIVAMTGDGVNDAPSLVAADLGVAMGRIGTEVAKEASDIILLDDNFGSVIRAVEEGRTILATIKKVILYLFSTSTGEVLTITAALFLGYPLPLLAAQIIWLNFVTDGFLDVALAMESQDKNVLRRRLNGKQYFVDKLMIERIIIMALPMMIGTLLIFREYFEVDLVKGWTMSLTTLAAFQWFNAWNCRHESQSIFKLNPLSNKFLVGATGVVIALQLLAVYNPALQQILHTTSLELREWLIAIGVASSIVVFEEVRKFLYRRRKAILDRT